MFLYLFSQPWKETVSPRRSLYYTRHIQTSEYSGKFLDCQSKLFFSVEFKIRPSLQKSESVIQRYIICIAYKKKMLYDNSRWKRKLQT